MIEKEKNHLTYRHPEAFCLMEYRCKECGASEILWNSRDGVTPFGIRCLKCGKNMLHSNWEKDRCMPDFKPNNGMRIFTDLTPEKHREYMKKRADMFWNNEKYKELGARDRYNSLEEFIDSLCHSFHPGEPDIEVVKK